MSKHSLHPDTNPEATTETCRVCKGKQHLPLSDDPAVIGLQPCSFCRGLGVVTKPNLHLKEQVGRVSKPTLHTINDARSKEHWAVSNPGLADQFRAEAKACREALGFDPDSQDVSPSDLRQAIENLKNKDLT